MYGLENFNDEQFQQLLGDIMPESQTAVTPQAAQLTQGLLGSADGQSNNQDQKLRGLISSSLNAAAQMEQNAQPMAQAPDSSLEQRQAASQQMAQQAAARQQQQQQASGSLLGRLISTFIPGGSVLGFLRR